jgi:hypothetical protein
MAVNYSTFTRLLPNLQGMPRRRCLAAFNSVSSAVSFAMAAQRRFQEYNDRDGEPLEVKIGISAGEPVTDESNDLFGAAVQLAARLCDSAVGGEIVTSVAVRELCIGKAGATDPGGTNLGSLQAEIGDFFYDGVTDDLEAGEWTVLVWCEPFAVAVAGATITPV